MSALPSVSEFGAWLATTRDLRATPLAGAAAASNLVVAYARALARIEGHDEHAAMLAALWQVRASHGEDVAEEVAEAQGVGLDGLLDQEREDGAQVERERQFEESVPWGRE